MAGSVAAVSAMAGKSGHLARERPLRRDPGRDIDGRSQPNSPLFFWKRTPTRAINFE